MKNTVLPQTPTSSRFGWPHPRRIQEFQKLIPEAKGTTRIFFKGKPEDIPTIRVPIELPKYRMANGRTVSLQAEHLVTHTGCRIDLFSGDPELWDAQEAQHQLLLKLARLSDLQKYFEDTNNRQIDAIIVDENGFVINGNRRLCCWRELLHIDPKQYAHFLHIDVAVLPHCDEKEIDRLEATLQIEKDIKAEYSWDAKANMILAKQKRDHFSEKDIGDLYSMKESEIHELLDMRSYADEYLRSRGKADCWSLVSDNEFAFKKIVSSRQKINGMGDQELFKHAAFVLIDKPDEAGGRLYEVIPAIVEGLDALKCRLQEEFNTKPISNTNDELEGILGGGVPGKIKGVSLQLTKEIQNSANTSKARKIIVEVIESQKQLKKDSKTEMYLLNCCADAHARLTVAVKSGLRPESKLDGVVEQLNQIDDKVERIRKFVSEHAKN